MPPKTNKRAPSLLDSKKYQGALKFNQIESNKLDKFTNFVEKDRNRLMSLQNQEWVSTQKWLLDIKTSTGQADLEKYNKILMESSEEADDSTPQYYFMYGMRIGERPQLLKNFLGRTTKSRSRRDFASKTKGSREAKKSTSQCTENEEAENTSLEKEKVIYNQIIIDGEVITQLPIGYSKSCSRMRNSYSSCTSQKVKNERRRKPLYFTQKHQYLIAPPSMFS